MQEGTVPIWRTLRAAQARAREALAGGRGSSALREQVARELALLSASDWPFMVTRGRTPGYALERVDGHAQRVHELCDRIELTGVGAELDGDVGTQLDGDRVPPDASAIVAALDPED